jgi:hypothetical protein
LSTAGDPIFILCTARSGSTLLRYILDTHPAIFAPAEMHLGRLCHVLQRVFLGVAGPHALDAAADIRQHVDAIMDDHTLRHHKRVWCEKSVRTVDYLELVYRVYPEARYICLYRGCLDVVRSSLDVTEYGFAGYGFEDYIRGSVGNTVDALVDYWHDKVSLIRRFELAHPAQAYSVRYEALVLDTDCTLRALFEFLQLRWTSDLTSAVFSTPHVAGPGDDKILHATSIEPRVGRGLSIPIARISEDRRRKMNTLMGELGYPGVERP